jgi:hypothetical protein
MMRAASQVCQGGKGSGSGRSRGNSWGRFEGWSSGRYENESATEVVFFEVALKIGGGVLAWFFMFIMPMHKEPVGQPAEHSHNPQAMGTADATALVILRDGIYMNSEVWINGQFLGRRPYGFIGFRYDLTQYLKTNDSPNVLAVRVDDSLEPSLR